MPEAIGTMLSDVGVEVVAAVILAIMGYMVRRYYLNRVRVLSYGSLGSKRYANQFCELFTQLIPEDQQISPNIILRHSGSSQSALRSAWGLRRFRKRNPNRPVIYQLYLAVHDRQVVGFLNTLINLRENYTFISYLGASPNKSLPIGHVPKKLLAALFRRARHLPGDPLAIFEIAPPASQSSTSRAKMRLFAEYVRLRDLEVRRAPVAYVQPDMEPRQLDGITETPADFCLVSTQRALTEMTQERHLTLIKSVYHDIYLKTFLDLGEHARYVTYIANLFEAVKDRELQNVPGLD